MSRGRLVALIMLIFSAFLNFPDTVVYGYQLVKVPRPRKNQLLRRKHNVSQIPINRFRFRNAPWGSMRAPVGDRGSVIFHSRQGSEKSF